MARGGAFAVRTGQRAGRSLFVQDVFSCAEPVSRTPVRVITETAPHSLFARGLLLRARAGGAFASRHPLTISHVARFQASPEVARIHSGAFIILRLDEGIVRIGGTE